MCIPASGGHARHTRSIAFSFSRHARVDPTHVSRMAPHLSSAPSNASSSSQSACMVLMACIQSVLLWTAFPDLPSVYILEFSLHIFLISGNFFESYLTGAFSMMRISRAFFCVSTFILLCFQGPHAPCSLPCPEVFLSVSACGCTHRHAVPPSALMCLICLVWCVMCLSSSRFLAVCACMCAV